MPAVSETQRRFFGAELARVRAGQRTKTHMRADEMATFARKPIRRQAGPTLADGLRGGAKGWR